MRRRSVHHGRRRHRRACISRAGGGRGIEEQGARGAVSWGRRKGIEARLVPASGFPIEYIEIGGLKGVGCGAALGTLWRLPVSTLQALDG